jgi:hypothetical protein
LLVVRYQHKVASLVSRYVPPGDIADVVQESFVKAWRALDSFRGDSAFYTWLYRIAVNTATFVGQKRKGAMGGITATLGVVFPSLVIITILAGLITNFAHLAWVQNAFAGIQVCVCVLILNAVLKLLKKSVVDKRTAVIFVIVLLGNMLLSVSPVWFVLLSAMSGIVLKNLEGRAAK